MQTPFIHPARWRDTVDPFSLPFTHFTLTKVLGYPHAGNDVFQAEGLYRSSPVSAYIKVARRPDAAVLREAAILPHLMDERIPKVLDAGHSPVAFCVTEALPGLRLSVILGQNEHMDSLLYMEEYGRALARIHQMTPPVDAAPHRRFMDAPDAALLDKCGLSVPADAFCIAPADCPPVFCHGDFHYANVLWKDGHISAMADWELCGMGDRDYDIAWAIVRRPGQTFLKTEAEVRRFLTGYRTVAPLNEERVLRHMARIYVYFLAMNLQDEEYSAFVRAWLHEHL